MKPYEKELTCQQFPVAFRESVKPLTETKSTLVYKALNVLHASVTYALGEADYGSTEESLHCASLLLNSVKDSESLVCASLLVPVCEASADHSLFIETVKKEFNSDVSIHLDLYFSFIQLIDISAFNTKLDLSKFKYLSEHGAFYLCARICIWSTLLSYLTESNNYYQKTVTERIRLVKTYLDIVKKFVDMEIVPNEGLVTHTFQRCEKTLETLETFKAFNAKY